MNHDQAHHGQARAGESILSGCEQPGGGAPKEPASGIRANSESNPVVIQRVTRVTRRRRKPLTPSERQRRWRKKHPKEHAKQQRAAYERKKMKNKAEKKSANAVEYWDAMLVADLAALDKVVSTGDSLAVLLESVSASDCLGELKATCRILDLDTSELEQQITALGISFAEWIAAYRADAGKAQGMLKPYSAMEAEQKSAQEAKDRLYFLDYLKPRGPEPAAPGRKVKTISEQPLIELPNGMIL